MDAILLWASQQLAGFAFGAALQPVAELLGDVTKGTSEKILSDWFKDTLKAKLRQRQQDDLSLAMGKATAFFLYLLQQELEGCGLNQAELVRYEPALNSFLRETDVQRWLAKAFEPGCQALDGAILARVWQELGLPPLPEDVRWGKIGRVYLHRVEGLLGESPALQELFSAKQLMGIKEATRQVAGVVPDFDLERYGRSLRDAYDKLRLNPIDTTYSNYRVGLWSLFEPQNARESPHYGGAESPKEEELLRQQTLFGALGASPPSNPSIVAVLREPECPLAVILGDPGAGKSSLLRFLALDWAERPTAQIPLLIELREYMADENRPKDVLEFFHQGRRKICELNQLRLHQHLEAGDALVMFDGLDEIMAADKRHAAIREIIAFKNKYPRSRLLVTSRIVGYDPEELDHAGFRHFTLDDFNAAQIASFIRKWHGLALGEAEPGERAELSQRLSSAIQSSPSIRLLAGNPLLLTMMAILNRKQELPRRRASLYEKSAEVLLHAWDIDHKKMALPLEEADLSVKQELLRRVAYTMHTQARGQERPDGAHQDIISIQREDLQNVIIAFMAGRNAANPQRIATLLIEQLRRRDFMLCHLGNDFFAFVHRTFLEYFCASEIVMRFSKRGTAEGWSLEQLKQEVFRAHWPDQSWHEVMRLIIGHELVGPAFAEDILLDLLQQKVEKGNLSAVLLAADCYLEIEQKHKVGTLAATLCSLLREALLRGELAETVTKKLITLWPDDADLRSWLEQQAAEHDNSAVRTGIVKGIAALELPASPIVLMANLGCLFYYQNRFQESIDYFRKNQPKSDFQHSCLTRAHIALAHHQAAIDVCQQWLILEPNNGCAMQVLGTAFGAAGQFKEAVTSLEKAGELFGSFSLGAASCLLDIARTYQDMGRYDLVIASYERSKAFAPVDLKVHKYFAALYANICCSLGLDEAAELSYLKALALDEKSAIAHMDLGRFFRVLERWQEAIACFERVLEINPKYSGAYSNRALVRLLRGEWLAAEKDIRTALQVKPHNASARLLLGDYQALSGDLNTAQATWRDGLILYPKYGLIDRVECTIYSVALGQPEQGLAELQTILQQERPPAGLLRGVLEIARLLQRCPEPLPGLAEAVRLLDWGRENAPVFELKPPPSA